MFIDEAKIRVKAGDGGNGCMAFRREKFVPRGGPSGGDGGNGGDVIMESIDRHNTLIHFRYNPEYKADRGRHGEGSNCTGREGENLIVKVPVGTILYDQITGEKIHDFSRPDERLIIAKGGRGGRGNQHFATPTHQAPREHELGRAGEERAFRLELKLLADVGLVGYPNAGKSTLISRISAAKPKIASYPFTTLEPNLGVVSIGESATMESYVVADIPGLIEGAHRGQGLGIQFLRHIERTRVLLHLIDVSDSSGRPDPIRDFHVILGELEQFSRDVISKPMVIVATKTDVANKEKLIRLREYCDRRNIPILEVSVVTGDNIQKLKYEVARVVRQMRQGVYMPPKMKPEPAEYREQDETPIKAPAGRVSAKMPAKSAKKAPAKRAAKKPSSAKARTAKPAAKRATKQRTGGKAKARVKPTKPASKRKAAS